tara:strand:- start:715 stop:987 length:273 start_codon:yes stop_codon:yes gene_type:complete
MPGKKKGLYANIDAKRKRIKAGSGERMRSPGSKGAPSRQDFIDSAKTAKMNHGGEAKKMMQYYNGGGPASHVAKACGDVMDDRRKITKFS